MNRLSIQARLVLAVGALVLLAACDPIGAVGTIAVGTATVAVGAVDLVL